MERLTFKKRFETYKPDEETTAILISDYTLAVEKEWTGTKHYYLIGEAVDKLAEYEDAEEQGLLPKFHLGDEFWTLGGWWDKPKKEKIVMLQQKKDGTWKYRFPKLCDCEEKEFGKYFFATKEEAEQALAKMDGKEEGAK